MVVDAAVDDALPNADVELLRLLVVLVGDTQPTTVAASTTPIIIAPSDIRWLACSAAAMVRLDIFVMAFLSKEV